MHKLVHVLFLVINRQGSRLTSSFDFCYGTTLVAVRDTNAIRRWRVGLKIDLTTGLLMQSVFNLMIDLLGTKAHSLLLNTGPILRYSLEQLRFFKLNILLYLVHQSLVLLFLHN